MHRNTKIAEYIKGFVDFKFDIQLISKKPNVLNLLFKLQKNVSAFKNYKKENYNIKEWKQIFNNRQFRKMNN